MQEAIRIGIGGAIGAGKTSLIELLCRRFARRIDMSAIFCDPYSDHDAAYLRNQGVLASKRILSVQLGSEIHLKGSINREMIEQAIQHQQRQLPKLELILIESPGDGRELSFHPGAIDASIFVIDSSVSDRILHKGGSGIANSDLLLINKIDRCRNQQSRINLHTEDAIHWRGAQPFVFCSLTSSPRLEALETFIDEKVALVRSCPVSEELVPW